MRIVVYTAIIGTIDRLWSVAPVETEAEFVAFVDQRRPEVGRWRGDPPQLVTRGVKRAVEPRWEQRIVEPTWGSRRTARHYKALPHRYLASADVWIWIDGNVRLRISPEEAVDRWLIDDLVVLPHPRRLDLYQEALVCAEMSKDSRQTLVAQCRQYRRLGHPYRWGLACTRVVMRRNTWEMEELNEAWWRELDRHSVRDQVSFPFVCWDAGLDWATIPGPHIETGHPGLQYIRHET